MVKQDVVGLVDDYALQLASYLAVERDIGVEDDHLQVERIVFGEAPVLLLIDAHEQLGGEDDREPLLHVAVFRIAADCDDGRDDPRLALAGRHADQTLVLKIIDGGDRYAVLTGVREEVDVYHFYYEVLVPLLPHLNPVLRHFDLHQIELIDEACLCLQRAMRRLLRLHLLGEFDLLPPLIDL